jgi:acetyl-CoA C-acetyltransferase
MPTAVITSAMRTPVGTAGKGSLVNTTPEELTITALRAAVERSGFDPGQVDDVVIAEGMMGGGAIARYAGVALGLIDAGGMAVNRHCAGSLSAVGVAAASIVSGMEDVVAAGGVNSGSFMPRMQQRNPATQEFEEWWIPSTHPETPDAPTRDMSITVGWNTAQALGLSREEMDAWALRSHQRAIAAIDAGHFVDEIVPVTTIDLQGNAIEFSVDEHPRRETSMEKLASLKVLHPEIEGFSITAGNSSGMNDAAAALMVASKKAAKAAGADILATIHGWTAVGIAPRDTGLSVPKVVEKLLARTGRKQGDIALWEINEAFASVPLGACRTMGLNEDTVNISGSGCSIGHPIGASGARMLTTLRNDLKRRGGGLGIAAMCAGGGQAGAVLIEV